MQRRGRAPNVRLTKAQRSAHPALHGGAGRLPAERSRRRARSTSTTTRRPRSCRPSPGPVTRSSSRSASPSRRASRSRWFSPADFATAVGAYRKAVVDRGQRAAGRDRRPRPCRAQRHFGARGRAGADRRRERRSRPRRGAAGADLDGRRSRHDRPRNGRKPDGRPRRSHPRAGLRNRRRQADHAGPAAPGRLVGRVHRRQSLAGLGAGADRSERPFARSAVDDAATIDPRQRHGAVPRHGREYLRVGRSEHARGRRADRRSQSRRPPQEADVRRRLDRIPGASARACWCRSRRCFATTRICRSSMSRCPTAASPGAT